jgi:hypothetical protein
MDQDFVGTPDQQKANHLDGSTTCSPSRAQWHFHRHSEPWGNRYKKYEGEVGQFSRGVGTRSRKSELCLHVWGFLELMEISYIRKQGTNKPSETQLLPYTGQLSPKDCDREQSQMQSR